MKYIFIINGRPDYSNILPEVERQLDELAQDPRLNYELHVTEGPGEATRFVRLYCEFHEDEDVCFVSCGGSGIANEVGAGLIGKKNKYLAMLAYGASNDLLKMFPGRDFRSVKEILDGEMEQIDVIKCNDDYALNVISVGFDAIMTNLAVRSMENSGENVKSDNLIYLKHLPVAFFMNRFNKYTFYVDGEKIKRRYVALATIANGGVYGKIFHCAPKAVVNDGYLEFTMIRPMFIWELNVFMYHYINGTHLESSFCRRRMIYKRARKVTITSKQLIYNNLDGEIIAYTNYDIELLDKAITLIIPKKKDSDVKKLEQ